ncbi:spore germination protein [Tumebacillus permanentifrigoris]|uniref:Spore germination protein KA n=1 Tax=Tumebacillus permanentifrigoris TaxID=378543 RepID=A0A316DAQ0_9BACL|nr:spore germination protein [Tumebacillus permanentifrigoris]PWK10242.1 spore germination protein KA [Tumebacillus permanentifrigoris]
MWKRKTARKHQSKQHAELLNTEKLKQQRLTSSLQDNLDSLKDLFGHSPDLITRPFPGGMVLCIKTIVDLKRMEESVLATLQDGLRLDKLAAVELFRVQDQGRAVQELLEGSVLIFQQNAEEAFAIRIGNTEHRAIEEPQTESVIRGPRDGFTESIDVNLALVRRRLKTPSLRVEEFNIGEVSRTKVQLLSIEGITSSKLVNEMRQRLETIRIDGIMESNYIEEFIEDSPFGLFPTIQNTERPDVISAALLEGRVALLVDSTPFALVAPLTFWGALQSSEDYYSHFTVATALRWIRFVFLFIALLFPSIYVAITTYHQEMLPTNLLLSVASAREGSPFPALVEALMMEVTFEALREAGVRLPRPVGQAVSIVGALVIGQAAVEAGIISAPMVIVVSITGIASFTIPRYNFGIAMRLLRFPIILLAGTLGLFGIVIAIMILMIHLSSLRSLGVPYLYPVSPFSWQGLKDAVVRVPHWAKNRRPFLLQSPSPLRVPAGQNPEPPIQTPQSDAKGGTDT